MKDSKTSNIKDFAVFILTYGRPLKVYTDNYIKECEYTGDVYLVVSTDDKSLDDYKEIHGDRVLVFDKEDIKKKYDHADNFDNSYDGVVYFARNAAIDFAKDMGYKYHLQLDDDYVRFAHRKIKGWKLLEREIHDLEWLFSLYIEVLRKSPQLNCIAMAQNGDFIGGMSSSWFSKGYVNNKRKIMNTFFIKTYEMPHFIGRINEDVNTYTHYQKRGFTFATNPSGSVKAKETQSNSGGMTEVYLDNGTYLKTFYSVMIEPGIVKIGYSGDRHLRIHHRVNWDACAPMIIREQHKKT